MASRGKQLDQVQAALAALQEEIKEAKKKVNTAEERVEKAILEGKPGSPFDKLYDGAVANLTRLGQEKAELLKRETLLLRSHSSRDEETQEISPVSDGSPKRQEIDKLIRSVKKYLLRTLNWGCVTVIGKKRAVTFAHKEHRFLKSENEIKQIKDSLVADGKTDIDSEIGKYVSHIKVYSIEKASVESESRVKPEYEEYDFKVIRTNAKSDWVLLECEKDLCQDKPKWGPVVNGHRYVQLGLSAPHQSESPFAISSGVISSHRPNEYGHTLGSAGANPGDSGGGCFDVDDPSGSLIGINVGCENVPISFENDTGGQIFDKISSRYASRAHIIPVSSFQFF